MGTARGRRISTLDDVGCQGCGDAEPTLAGPALPEVSAAARSGQIVLFIVSIWNRQLIGKVNSLS
jgi:hypothetical protein